MKLQPSSIIITISVIILGILGLRKINKDFYVLWNSNTINVRTDNNLLASKVKIEFGMSAISNSDSDSDLFENRKKYIVLFDGTKKKKCSMSMEKTIF